MTGVVDGVVEVRCFGLLVYSVLVARALGLTSEVLV